MKNEILTSNFKALRLEHLNIYKRIKEKYNLYNPRRSHNKSINIFNIRQTQSSANYLKVNDPSFLPNTFNNDVDTKILITVSKKLIGKRNAKVKLPSKLQFNESIEEDKNKKLNDSIDTPYRNDDSKFQTKLLKNFEKKINLLKNFNTQTVQRSSIMKKLINKNKHIIKNNKSCFLHLNSHNYSTHYNKSIKNNILLKKYCHMKKRNTSDANIILEKTNIPRKIIFVSRKDLIADFHKHNVTYANHHRMERLPKLSHVKSYVQFGGTIVL